MKKFLSVVLTAIICCIVFCGCDLNSTYTTSTVTSTSTITYGETYDDYSSSEEIENDDIWELSYYVDDFQEETDEWFVANTNCFVGTFSNSATNNSLLTARIYVDAENAAIMMYEYDKYQVKNIYSHSVEYSVEIQGDNGQRYSGWGEIYDEGDRVILDDDTEKALIKYLKTNNSVKIYLKEGISSYLFTAQCGNFADLIE